MSEIITCEEMIAIAKERGCSEIAINAWLACGKNCTHDFMPWEFDNITGKNTRGPGITGFAQPTTPWILKHHKKHHRG